MERVANLIGGADSKPRSGAWLTKRAPTDGQVLCELARSGVDDIADAVRAASDSQPAWAARTAVDRGTVLRRAAELLRAHGDELVGLVRRETGKPLADAEGELEAAVEMAYFVAGEGRRLYGRTTTSAVPSKTVSFVRSPVGVAGLVVAANTPIPNYAWKVLPALLCGNAAVLKPSEDTPMSARRFGRLFEEAGVPPGVLNVVQGLGDEAGAALVAHPGVDLVSFTGSAAAGRRVAVTAGGRLAKVCLELGGSNALVVCDDADIDVAVRAAVLSAFSNAGQRCAAGSRIVVFHDVYDEFRDKMLARTATLTVGTGDDADLGPLVSEHQLARVAALVEGARGRGARLLQGGHRLGDAGRAGGCFFEPTVLERVDGPDPLEGAEVFGPVCCLQRVAGFDEALAAANASPYGLTAAIHTASIHRAMEFARRVRAGMAVVNGPTYGSEPHMPFGGFGDSGNGFREAGTEALDVFSEWKNVSIIHQPARA